MGLSRGKFSKEMKVAAIQQLEMGTSAAEVARAFEVNPNLLHRWRKEFRHGPGNAFPAEGKRRWDEAKVAQLERKVGQQTLEIDFLKGCLRRLEEARMLQALHGKPRSTNTFKSRSKGRPDDEPANVRVRAGEPGWPISIRPQNRTSRRRSGSAG